MNKYSGNLIGRDLGNFNRKKKKTLWDKVKEVPKELTLSIAGLGLVASVVAYDGRDVPEAYEGFENLTSKGYEIVESDMPTKGDVVLVKKLENENYQTIQTDEGLELEGDFYYKIRPQSKFCPKDDQHSDRWGRTPENSDYWGATRKGKVVLRK